MKISNAVVQVLNKASNDTEVFEILSKKKRTSFKKFHERSRHIIDKYIEESEGLV